MRRPWARPERRALGEAAGTSDAPSSRQLCSQPACETVSPACPSVRSLGPSTVPQFPAALGSPSDPRSGGAEPQGSPSSRAPGPVHANKRRRLSVVAPAHAPHCGCNGHLSGSSRAWKLLHGFHQVPTGLSGPSAPRGTPGAGNLCGVHRAEAWPLPCQGGQVWMTQVPRVPESQLASLPRRFELCVPALKAPTLRRQQGGPALPERSPPTGRAPPRWRGVGDAGHLTFSVSSPRTPAPATKVKLIRLATRSPGALLLRLCLLSVCPEPPSQSSVAPKLHRSPDSRQRKCSYLILPRGPLGCSRPFACLWTLRSHLPDSTTLCGDSGGKCVAPGGHV